MGQAKARKVEIDKLKSNSRDNLHIIAVLHTMGETERQVETFAFESPYPNNCIPLRKDELLDFICHTDWKEHTDIIAGAITQYFVQTDSYKMMTKMAPVYGFMVNFYAEGTVDDKPANVYACREVQGVYSKEYYNGLIGVISK